MASNFALSLASDGMRLLHRVDGGWALVGEVAGGSADIASALAALRRKAERLEPSGLRTKLLIPNGQIKYVAIDGNRAGDDEIRAALEGATPYEVDELVWDTTRGGGRIYIAAVPRETLEEAESFAIAHRFAPVSFAAVPAPFTFRGEAYFGPTSVAGAEADARDPRPVAIVADLSDAPDAAPDALAEPPAPASRAEPPPLPPDLADRDVAGPDEPDAGDMRPPGLGMAWTGADLADEAAGDPGPEVTEPEPIAEPPEPTARSESPDPQPARPAPPPLAAEARPAEAAVSFSSRARVVREAAERTLPPPLERRVAAEASAGAAFVRRRDEPAPRPVGGPRPGPHGSGRGAAAPALGSADRPAAAMPRAAVAAPPVAPRASAATGAPVGGVPRADDRGAWRRRDARGRRSHADAARP